MKSKCTRKFNDGIQFCRQQRHNMRQWVLPQLSITIKFFEQFKIINEIYRNKKRNFNTVNF